MTTNEPNVESDRTMELATAEELGREEAERYPEGPWPPVLAELQRLRAIEAAAREIALQGGDLPHLNDALEEALGIDWRAISRGEQP